MLSIMLLPPADILAAIGQRAKDARLALGLTRKTLAERSGVPEPTIKRFETTGYIGTAAMVQIAIALDMAMDLEGLFFPKPIRSVKDISKKRQRGVV
jgi:transcriptional regulator with XRE-family HTH domain